MTEPTEAPAKNHLPWKIFALLGCSFVVALPLLVTLVLPNLIERTSFATPMAAKANILSLSSALQEYALRSGGVYPDSLEALVEPDANGVTFLDAMRAASPGTARNRKLFWRQP